MPLPSIQHSITPRSNPTEPSNEVASTTPPENERVLVSNATAQSITIIEYADGSARLLMDHPPIHCLNLSGGGVKGAAYSGAIAALEAMDVLEAIRLICGVSAGAISAALLASGMNHKGFDRISDDIPLISLLDSAKADVSAEQQEWSRMGVNMKALPFVQLLCDLLPRLGSEGTKLKELIRQESCAALLDCCEQQTELSEDAQRAIANVRNNQYVTFGDLKVLSEEIKQIKALEIAGTAMYEDGAQRVVFCAELTPEMDIAEAALISAALPIVFSKPTQQGLPFQLRKQEGSNDGVEEITKFVDGGVKQNTPIHGLDRPTVRMSPIPDADTEQLILVFESEPGETKKHGTGPSTLVDKILGTSFTADGARLEERLKPFKDKTIVVPMKVKSGDYSGTFKGTINFPMSKEVKNELQEALRKKTVDHLNKRNAEQLVFHFPSAQAALLALNNDQFSQLQTEPEGRETYAQVSHFRREAGRALANLKDAIRAANEMSNKLEPNPALLHAISALDDLADQPDKLEWLAKSLNHGNDPDFMQLLQAAVLWDEGASDVASIVTSRAIEEMRRHDLAARIDNVIEYVLYPSRYLGGQPQKNLDLIAGALRELSQVQNETDFNKALIRLIANYKSRLTGLTPFSSTTIDELKKRLIKPRTPI
ncbi:patatin-like phospholipase family protein [Pseudomonas sp. SMV71]|uniref:patatin-like phospholipase family protein n=1 Tax=Pseudomonas sp. SMV71 TaxID=3390195 RepID=UPI003F83D2D6